MPKSATPPSPTVAWNIANLERKVEDGFVFVAHWTVEAEDNGYRASSYGSVGFERPENLIPFEDLTKEQIIEWVKEALGNEQVLAIGQALLDQLEQEKNPPMAFGVPWA